jgi:enediyne biosynthesis protein E4
MVVTNIGQKAYLLRNDGGSRNGWIRLALTGKKSNRDGIGCRVKVTSASNLTQHYTVNTAAGYLSASDKRLLIGLGASHAAKSVELTWPSGLKQTFENVASGTTLRASEPAPAH